MNLLSGWMGWIDGWMDGFEGCQPSSKKQSRDLRRLECPETNRFQLIMDTTSCNASHITVYFKTMACVEFKFENNTYSPGLLVVTLRAAALFMCKI